MAMIDALTLHRTIVQARQKRPTQSMLFLHGILGSGSNLRAVATRFVEARPSWAAVLVDLRGHGRSEPGAPPHSLAACAEDLVRMEATLDHPVRGVAGHSFGGKVALSYHTLRPTLQRVILLDCAPGARRDGKGSEQTLAVVKLLEQLPKQFPTRDAFVAAIQSHGYSEALAEWLAMNLARTPDGFALRTDLAVIRRLLDDYFGRDLWPTVETSGSQIDVVIGGRSTVWNEEDLRRAQRAADRAPHRVRIHRLAEAGHWVHVDEPSGVLSALLGPAAATP